MVALGLWALWAAPAALAEEAARVSVTTSRVTLRDVFPECPASACDADLGPAPPAGSSRVIGASSIRDALSNAGADGRAYRGPTAVRVTSSKSTLAPAQLVDWVRPSIERSLPVGVTLTSIEAKSAVTVPLAASAGSCAFPALPKRAGPFATTVMVDVLHEGALVKRVPVLVRVVVSEAAARPDVTKGQTVTLVIERRTAVISTQGIALNDAQKGQTAPFRVLRTGRVVNARVESGEMALVIEAQ
jgi:hypothetical protein